MDREQTKKDGDEEGEKDFKDPAIISCSSATDSGADYRYDKDVLLKLRKAPDSQRRPRQLDAAYYNQAGVWDPEPWHYSNKQAEAHAECDDAPAAAPPKQRQRPSDPRERLRKEQDGIVLSPQRRSFNSGCFVPGAAAPNVALPLLSAVATVPAGGKERRIGSGRILPWDYADKSEDGPPGGGDFGYSRRERRERDGDDRFERRSFGRDYDSSSSTGNTNNKEKRGGGRGFQRRMESREEEPEWFSSGPISQNDTIELRGFDDLPPPLEKSKKKPKRSINGGGIATGNIIASNCDAVGKKEKKKEALIGRGCSPTAGKTLLDGLDKGAKGGEQLGKANSAAAGAPAPDEDGFNFDAIFKADAIPIPGLLNNGIEAGDAAGSRFSRWFQREKSPPPAPSAATSADSRRSSKSLLGGDPFEPQVAIPQPGDAESYFAPISPAANTPQGQLAAQQQQEKSMNLMEMLQRGQRKVEPPPTAGKILSLEELEAKMRSGAPEKLVKSAVPPPPTSAGEDDVNAFKRLFSQMNLNGPQATAAPPPPTGATAGGVKPMSIMEMLSHSQQKDAEARHQRHHVAPPSQPPPPHMHSDVAYKLQQAHKQQQQAHLQQQLEMLAKMNMSGGFGGGAAARGSPPVHEINLAAAQAQGRELLNRPEAQAIMQGLKRGDITPQHLYQQLANPAMQPRHREMLHTILKMQQQQPPPPPAAQQQASTQHSQSVSPNFYSSAQQQQQLRVSPLPPNAYCVSPIMATSPNTLSVPALHQRIPSPRELQVHTQNIMQRALIKKKLEEQEENYRKKQQQAQAHRGGSPAGKTSSPTPLAFLPTSVMRKLNAEKDDSAKDNKEKMGRPLTGLRNPLPTSMMAQQQQHQQQQQQQQQLPPNWNHFAAMKQPGRAIVKANSYQAGGSQQEYFQQQPQQQRLMHQLMQHQQQQHHSQPPPPPPSQQPPPPQKTFYNHSGVQGGNGSMAGVGQQYHHQQLSQQLRQQHQNVRAQHQQQAAATAPPQVPPPSAQPANWMAGNFETPSHRDLSPTSDQLARWFSPDLLERARKGNVPSMPASAVAQHALSLEEIERQTTPVGHN